MVRQKAIPPDLTAVERKRLARQLTTATEAVYDALKTFAAAPAGGVSVDAI